MQQQYPQQQMPTQIMGMNQAQMPMEQQNPMMMGFSPVMMMQMMQMMQNMNNMGGGGGGGNAAGLSRNQVRDLFTKALNNRYKQVEELFAMGVPPDTRDEHGNTCMHVAA